MSSDTLNPLCIIVVKGGAEGGKLIFKVSNIAKGAFPYPYFFKIKIKGGGYYHF